MTTPLEPVALSSAAGDRCRPRWALAALGLSVGSFASLQSLLIPVLPTMQIELGVDAPGITWTLTAWLIASAVATPLLGRLGDVVGKRLVFLGALGAVAIGSLIAALAPNLSVLLLARVLQGVGGAMFPLGYSLVRDVLSRERVPGGIGTISALIAVGSGLGTVLAGPLSEIVGWRGLFVVPLAGVGVGGLLVVRFVPDRGKRASGGINVAAAVLLSGWLVALLLPLSMGAGWGWSSPAVIGLFVLSAALFAAWLFVELHSAEPLVDMRLMRLPGVWNTNFAAILIGAAMFGVWGFLARFLQEPVATGYGLGASAKVAGLVMLPMLAFIATIGFFAGAITRVIRLQVQLVAGSLLIAAPVASIALFHDSLAVLTVLTAIFGIGLGMSIVAMTNLVVQSVPPTQTGIASGMNANLRTIGASIGTALMTVIVTGCAAVAGESSEAGYTAGFLVMAALAALASIIAMSARCAAAGAAPERPSDSGL